jgi:hypothetical protein
MTESRSDCREGRLTNPTPHQSPSADCQQMAKENRLLAIQSLLFQK